MALDDVDRLRLAEIERQLEQGSPRLARSLRREPTRGRQRAAATVLGAVVVLLASFGWLSVQGGTPVPLLIASLPAAAVLATLWSQRSEPAPRAPAAEPAPGPDDPRDDPPWWLS